MQANSENIATFLGLQFNETTYAAETKTVEPIVFKADSSNVNNLSFDDTELDINEEKYLVGYWRCEDNSSQTTIHDIGSN